jgi:hypothetical protein
LRNSYFCHSAESGNKNGIGGYPVASLTLSSERPSWTWADLVSTYRFWGLLLFFVFSGIVSSSLSVNIAMLERQYGFTVHQIGLLFWTRIYAVPLGFWLAWAAIRSKPLPVLLTVAGFQVLAAALMGVGWPEGHQLAAVAVKFGCIYLADAVIQLVAPTVIAAAMGGGEMFFVAFGTMFLFRQFVGWVNPMLYSAVVASHIGWTAPLAAEALAGLICLAPVRHVLFTAAPPPRGRALEPVHRGPIITAILSTVVPFYFLYWSYRAHGEAAHLEPSRRLLSPRAGAWAFFGVPAPIILAALADHFNQRAASWGMSRVRRVWGVVLWGIFLMPVAIGLLQDALNRLSAHQRSLVVNKAAA